MIDLSALPPCHSSLLRHIKRANFVAAMWKRTENTHLDLPDITDHGWNIDGTIDWIGEPYPVDITEPLLGEDIEEEQDSDIDIDTESDSDDDLFD